MHTVTQPQIEMCVRVRTVIGIAITHRDAHVHKGVMHGTIW